MLELLYPFENLIDAVFGSGLIHQALSQVFLFARNYFNGFIDYFLFLTIAVPVFHLLFRRYRVAFLLIASFALIAAIYGILVALGMLLFPLVIHAFACRWQERSLTDPAFRRKAIGGLVSIVVLFYSFLFLRETFQWNLPLPAWQGGIMAFALHFCGMAYMLPKLIHYIADTLRGKIEKPGSTRFALYMIFFPTLRVGPIERFENFNRDIENMEEKGVKLKDVGYGFYRIFLGAGKITFHWFIILTHMAVTSSIEGINGMSWWAMYWMLPIAVVGVYLSFGGYTDVAIGFSRLLGFHIMENFYRPFFSPNIGEWWRRWHISLSFWLRDYVYYPLGGNRHHLFRNVLITFFVCGLWHGLAANYIIWGLGQGVGLVIWMNWRNFWRRVDKEEPYHPPLKPLVNFMKAHPRFSDVLGMVTTINYFCLTGIYFIFEFERANFYLLRYITFGLYQLN